MALGRLPTVDKHRLKTTAYRSVFIGYLSRRVWVQTNGAGADEQPGLDRLFNNFSYQQLGAGIATFHYGLLVRGRPWFSNISTGQMNHDIDRKIGRKSDIIIFIDQVKSFLALALLSVCTNAKTR